MSRGQTFRIDYFREFYCPSTGKYLIQLGTSCCAVIVRDDRIDLRNNKSTVYMYCTRGKDIRLGVVGNEPTVKYAWRNLPVNMQAKLA